MEELVQYMSGAMSFRQKGDVPPNLECLNNWLWKMCVDMWIREKEKPFRFDSKSLKMESLC